MLCSSFSTGTTTEISFRRVSIIDLHHRARLAPTSAYCAPAGHHPSKGSTGPTGRASSGRTQYNSGARSQGRPSRNRFFSSFGRSRMAFSSNGHFATTSRVSGFMGLCSKTSSLPEERKRAAIPEIVSAVLRAGCGATRSKSRSGRNRHATRACCDVKRPRLVRARINLGKAVFRNIEAV